MTGGRHEWRDWPLVLDAAHRFYVKPEGPQLLCSPADETPSPPTDAQPEELDVAICVDRIERCTRFEIRRIEHRWAGLRCFVADKTLVAGLDAEVPGFFWARLPTSITTTAPALVRATGICRGGAFTAMVRTANGRPQRLASSMTVVTGTCLAAFTSLALEQPDEQSGVLMPEDRVVTEHFYAALEGLGVPRHEIIEVRGRPSRRGPSACLRPGGRSGTHLHGRPHHCVGAVGPVEGMETKWIRIVVPHLQSRGYRSYEEAIPPLG